MNKQNEDMFNAEVSGDEAARLISNYGKQIEPEKKAALLAKLEAERGNFSPKIERTERTQERELER